MDLPLASRTAAPDAAVAFEGRWLFSPQKDLSILLIPLLVTGVAALMAFTTREGPYGFSQHIAGWVAQYVLGNGTHVILTFLLLGTRTDMLRATPSQPRIVLGGSAAVFAGVCALEGWAFLRVPVVAPLVTGSIVVLALHHTLSQVKGYWSLYELRASKAGGGPPTATERLIQRSFVPLSLCLLLIRFFLMPMTTGRDASPFINAGQGDTRLLPFATSYALLAVWVVFCAFALASFRGRSVQSGPKCIYLGVHAAVVAFGLVMPSWASPVMAGIHGFEYFFLTARMLEPGDHEAASRFTRRAVVPTMILVMSPIILVGISGSPFLPLLDSIYQGRASAPFEARAGFWVLARIAVDGVVLAHYFADAFIYRFRIPGIRKVALARLGFGP